VPTPVERSEFPILITDAQTVAGLACLRSLSRAGYPLYVIGESPEMLCFDSSCKFSGSICPPYSSPEFPEWCLSFCAAHGIRLVLPTERFLLALGDKLERLLPLLHARVSLETLQLSLSKIRLFDAFSKAPDDRLRINLPAFRVASLDSAPISQEIVGSWKAPYFVKCDVLESRSGSPARVIRVENFADLNETLKRLSPHYKRVLIQEYSPGRGAGAFMLRWDKKLVARFMHQRLHEVPYTGGHSSLRESSLDETLFADALHRAEFLNWEGPAMFEYRQDPQSGVFRLLELNARFWGSLHLALFAGVDFPLKLADLARGAKVPAQLEYPLGRIARLSVPGEIQHTWSYLKDKTVPLPKKLSKLAEFFLLFVKPGVQDDLFYPGDRWVFFSALRKYFLSFFRKR
jgi:hypothetical protein